MAIADGAHAETTEGGLMSEITTRVITDADEEIYVTRYSGEAVPGYYVVAIDDDDHIVRMALTDADIERLQHAFHREVS